MKLEDLRTTPDKVLSFEHRESAVDVIQCGLRLIFNFMYEHEPKGKVTFEPNEVVTLQSMLTSFFTVGQYGREFNYDTRLRILPELPMVRLSTTNWGEPYSRGISFSFSSDFDDYSLDNLSFSLEESDALGLLEFIERLTQKKKA